MDLKDADTLIYRSYTQEGGSEGVNVLDTYSGRMEVKGFMFIYAG